MADSLKKMARMRAKTARTDGQMLGLLEDLCEGLDAFVAIEQMARDQVKVNKQVASVLLGKMKERVADVEKALGGLDLTERMEKLSETPEGVEKAARIVKPGKPKVLVYGTMYMYEKPGESGQRWESVDMIKMWLKCLELHNPDYDLLLVDSDSSESLVKQLGIERVNLKDFDGNFKKHNILTFDENIGHLSKNGKDGWGRAFIKGIELAMQYGYDYAVHVESDLLFSGDIDSVIERMEREKVGFLVPWNNIYKWVETGLMFMNLDYLRKVDFINKYNWPKRTVKPTPEEVVGKIVKDEWKKLEMPGGRNDNQWMEHNAAGKRMPVLEYVKSLKYITHVPQIYYEYYLGTCKSLKEIKSGKLKCVKSLDMRDDKRKMAIIFLGTGKFVEYFDDYYRTCEDLFLQNTDKHYIVLTDMVDYPALKQKNVLTYNINHYPWPFCTLLKYHYINSIQGILADYKNVLFLDADMYINERVTEAEFSSKDKSLYGVIHPYIGHDGTFEPNPISTAFVPDHMDKSKYWQACLFGGKPKNLLRMTKTLQSNIDSDLEKDHIAVWHDESHLNRYFVEHKKDIHTFGVEMAFPEFYPKGNVKKIIHVGK